MQATENDKGVVRTRLPREVKRAVLRAMQAEKRTLSGILAVAAEAYVRAGGYLADSENSKQAEVTR